MSGFDSFNSTPATGPTYTDLARQVDRLKAELATISRVAKLLDPMLEDFVANGYGADVLFDSREQAARDLATLRTPNGGTALLDELERLRETCKTLNRRDGEIRQQAILDFAHELAEMEPAARDAAIRRIIDNHGDKP